MKRQTACAIFAILVIAGLVASPVPVYAQTMPPATTSSCNQSIAISTTSNGTTQIVALTAGQRIFICGFVLQGAVAQTIKLVEGTGVSCGTGTANLTGPFAFTTTPSSVPFGNGFGTVIRGTVSNALCITTTTTGQVQGLVTYGKVVQ